MDAQGEAVGDGQLGERAFQQDGVGAQIDVLAAVHQFLEELKDRGVDERFAAGDGDHRGAALLHRSQAFLQGQGLAQGVLIFLDAAAALAGQVALMGGLQHQDQGEFFCPLKPLLQQIATQIETETERKTHVYLF